MFIPDPDLDFLAISDPGVQKAPDPGSGSATLPETVKYLLYVLKLFLIRFRNYWRGNFCHSSLNKKKKLFIK
jgi:hypothetical protein